MRRSITFLGSPERLAADVFAAHWRPTELPRQVVAGEPFTVTARLVNRSAAVWPAQGAARVQLAYHWRDAAGGVVEWDGARTPLPQDVPPRAAVRAEMTIRAPVRPGRYVLELDPVFEHVAWFSERHPASVLRGEVEVVAAGATGGAQP